MSRAVPSVRICRPAQDFFLEPFVVLPLYIYPTFAAWQPLFNAAERDTDLQFMVIVNPYNGPGPPNLPDDNYLEVLGQLCRLRNVKILGYVATTYGERPAADVIGDIEVYAAWRPYSKQLRPFCPIRVDGIFFDEAPADLGSLEYARDIDRHAKSLMQLDMEGEPYDPAAGKPRAPMQAITMLNPGRIIPNDFYRVADYIVAFEERSGQWSMIQDTHLRHVPERFRNRTVIIAHTAHDGQEQKQISQDIRRQGYLGQFVTTTAGYTSWCANWDAWAHELVSWNRLLY